MLQHMIYGANEANKMAIAAGYSSGLQVIGLVVLKLWWIPTICLVGAIVAKWVKV